MKAVVTSKGQITIPISVRLKANIMPGSKLDFQVEEDGSIRVSMVDQDVSQLKGIIKSKRRKPASLKEMKKAIHDASRAAMQ